MTNYFHIIYFNIAYALPSYLSRFDFQFLLKLSASCHRKYQLTKKYNMINKFFTYSVKTCSDNALYMNIASMDASWNNQSLLPETENTTYY